MEHHCYGIVTNVHFPKIGEALQKEKRKGYDSDEDEANPLVIEEEDVTGQADESLSENDTRHDSDDKLNSKTRNVSFFSIINNFYASDKGNLLITMQLNNIVLQL